MRIIDIYNAYPGSDLLPVDVAEDMTLEDIEFVEATGPGIGDTLFVFLCRELANPDDELDADEAARRCESAMDQIAVVRDAVLATAAAE